MFQHQFLYVYQVRGYLPDWLAEGWVLNCHLNLFGHTRDVVSAVTAINNLVYVVHRHHVLGQNCSAFPDALNLVGRAGDSNWGT
jgi:hypothetical protein